MNMAILDTQFQISTIGRIHGISKNLWMNPAP
jgi:hypothetical protein